MKKKLVIIGAGTFAEVACEYFAVDSDYEVVAFAVDRAYLTQDTMMDRPVVAFEECATRYRPQEHSIFVAITYLGLNRVRADYLTRARALGYRPASYVSSRAWLAPSARLGEHCFVFEFCAVQPGASLGENVVMWTGASVAHHSRIGDHSFLAAGSTVNGSVQIGESVFLGSNCTVSNHLRIGAKAIIGAGSVVLSDVPDDVIVKGVWKRGGEGEPSRLRTEFGLDV